MDRTTSRRIFNEFSSEIDLNSPDGIMRSSEVDRYIDNALKPLFEEGKAFKRVSINRRTGTRTTRYSYQGGKNIQDSINAVLGNMHDALGYDVDPATGNVKGTAAPPPMSITSQGRHTYNETRERILDPRTAASIRAQAHRVGGMSATDRASGFTTTLVRAGLSGETRAMRALVDNTDRRYLAGELPSSALADGASPATIEERARAQVARQANIRDARQQAVADYIRLNPGSQLAIDEAARLQRVTDRETRARVLAAERTPGTQEFDNRVFRNIRASAARQRAKEQFIEDNPDSNLARKQKEAEKNKNQANRDGAASMAVHVGRMILINILAAVGLVVSILTRMYRHLSDVKDLVRKQSLESAFYNIPREQLEDYRRFAVGHDLDQDIFGKIFGKIVERYSLPDQLDINSLGLLAPLMRGGTAHLLGLITRAKDSPDEIFDEIMKASIDTVMDKRNATGESYDSHSRAFVDVHERLRKYDADLAKVFAIWYRDAGPVSPASGTTVNNWNDFYNSRKGNPGREVGQNDPATKTAAEENVQKWNELVAIFDAMKTNFFEKLLGYVEHIVVYLRNLAREKFGGYLPAWAASEQAQAIADQTKAKVEIEGWLKDNESAVDRAFQIGIGKTVYTEEDKNIFIGRFRRAASGDLTAMDANTYNAVAPILNMYLHNIDMVKTINENLAKAETDDYVWHIAGLSPASRIMAAGDQYFASDLRRRQAATRVEKTGGVPINIIRGDTGFVAIDQGRSNIMDALSRTIRAIDRQPSKGLSHEEINRREEMNVQLRTLHEYMQSNRNTGLIDAIADIGWDRNTINDITDLIDSLPEGAIVPIYIRGLSNPDNAFGNALKRITGAEGVAVLRPSGDIEAAGRVRENHEFQQRQMVEESIRQAIRDNYNSQFMDITSFVRAGGDVNITRAESSPMELILKLELNNKKQPPINIPSGGMLDLTAIVESIQKAGIGD